MELRSLNPVHLNGETIQRRTIDYYIVALFAFAAFFIVSVGPFADFLEKEIKGKNRQLIAKGLIIFFIVYTIDVYMTKNWHLYTTTSNKYKDTEYMVCKEKLGQLLEPPVVTETFSLDT